jgi:hypothetical protein
MRRSSWPGDASGENLQLSAYDRISGTHTARKELASIIAAQLRHAYGGALAERV